MAVYANLMGRLGNQMFIYAMARSLQMRRGRGEALIFTGAEDDRLHNLPTAPYQYARNLSWRTGKNPAQIALSAAYGIKSRVLSDGNDRLRFERRWLKLLVKNGLYICRNGYLPLLDSGRGNTENVSVLGFFQSEKYFAEIKDLIIRELTPKGIDSGLTRSGELAENPRAVCVSIRLGDYLNHPVHGVCTAEYYARAMRMMQEKLGDPLFYVSTEDPAAVSAIPEFGSFYMIFENPALQDYEKLYLTAQCSHFILSNSTFSWWGYYLSQNRRSRGGITIAPDRWFNTAIPCDIYMDDIWMTGR